MYKSFYHLKEKPFDLHPDPDYLFMSHGHDNAYTHLEYALTENKGFVVITGEIGSGKTTLINYFLHKMPQDILVGLINNTHAPLGHFAKMICQEFDLNVDGFDKLELLIRFHEFLIRQFEKKIRVVLIIDEAQNLTPEDIEEIRLISNLETEKHHLIQIILVGQPELKYKLQGKNLEQFAQRVTVHCHLDRLQEDEADQYIRYRLKVAGAENLEIFEKDAIHSIYEYSKGIPRLMNILCDTALVYGFADAKEKIDSKLIEDVIQAREAGGIFKAADQNPLKYELLNSHIPSNEISDAGAAAATKVPELLTEKFQSMEQRINMLECMAYNLDRKMDSLIQKKDERDTIVLELFKLLKNSLENRIKTVGLFYQIRKKMEAPKKQNGDQGSDPGSPFLTRFKKKKKK